LKVALEIPLEGCLKKCASSLPLTTAGLGFNPYNTNPNSLSTITTFESTYTGTECLCGAQASNGYLTFNTRNAQSDQAGILTADLDPIAIGTVADQAEIIYEVTSGAAYQAQFTEKVETAGPIAGAVVGGIIAFVLFVAAFWFISHKKGEAAKDALDSLMAKTTSPLAGVQLALLVLATSLALAAVFSAEMYTIIVGIPASNFSPAYATTYSLGIFNHMTANTQAGVGTYFKNVGNYQLSYSCMQFVEDVPYFVGGSSDYTMTYVQACETTRAASVLAIFVGVMAVVCAFYQRQKAVLPLVIVAVICGMLSFGIFQAQIVDNWVSEQVEENPWTQVYGNAFNCLVASFFFFLLEIAASIIDSMNCLVVD